MSAFTPITPMKAVELVEAAGIEDARRIIADYAAADLVKSYALVIEIIDARGVSACVRGSKIGADLWQRIVFDGVADDVWSSGTVRLAGSDLVGGDPAAIITGITFNPSRIRWLIAHHTGVEDLHSVVRERNDAGTAPVTAPTVSPEGESGDQPHRKPSDSAIPPGALLATVDQTMAALGLSRGTINNMMNDGRLVRRHIGRAVRIEVDGIHELAGANK